MAGEVISLLSSSSPPPVTPPRHASTCHVSSKPALVSDDVFDLTQLSPVAADTLRTDPAATSQQLPPPGRVHSHNETPVFFQSDDFDTTGDLDNSLICDEALSMHTGNNKRRRLSPSLPSKASTLNRSQSATVGSSRHSIRPSGMLMRHQLAADPIEFTSSPNIPPSAQPPRVDKDDPFASTPPNPPQLERKSIPTSSFDPFASDPAPVLVPSGNRTSPPVIELADDEDEDPFASSPRDSFPKTAAWATDTSRLATKPKPAKQPVEWDPISSSAPQLRQPLEVLDNSLPRHQSKIAKAKAPAIISLSDSEVSTHDVGILGEDEDEEFPDLADMDMSKYRPRWASSSPISRPRSRPKPTARAKPNPTAKKSTEERSRDKEAKATEREAEKERKRLEKEAAREKKARDKDRAAALAEVNKVRTDKKVSTPEMIVDLPITLTATLALQAQELLKNLGVEHTSCQTPVDNVIKWRRKVRSHFNDDLSMWEPSPLRIDNEPYAMAVVSADEFVSMALASEGEDLDAHVTKMRRHFPTQQLIYLIDGLNPWMRKNRNVRNRQFVSAVRAQESEVPSASQSRRRKNQAPRAYIDEDMVEDALLQLQVVHGVQIHHTAAPIETAQWIVIFTQHISTVPYRKQKEAANAAGAGFCMESGQVRTGEDVKDTYTKMLQEIVRVTAPIAYGIANEFETVTALIQGLEERGPLALEDCRKSANKDGALSDRAVGQAVSRRLHKVFTGRDESSTDV